MITWKRISPEDLEKIYPHIPEDFALGEYAPKGFMVQMLRAGLMEGFLFFQDGAACGYAFCQFGFQRRVVLLSLLAVFPEYRGRGLGGEILRLLGEQYRDWNGIYAEVEKPEYAEDAEEKKLRRHRIGFYERAGFVRGQVETNYSIWDVPYTIMILPLKQDAGLLDRDTQTAFHDIYDKVLGQENQHRMVF